MKICSKCASCYDDGFDLCALDGGVLVQSFAGPRVLGGRYRLEERLDSGSMGTVFRAIHQGVGSTVAAKVINPEWSGNAVIEARFRREAQALGQIKHPNAVLVIDFGVDARGMLFLVTEFLRGEPLSRRIQGKRLTLEEAERFVTPLCEAVEEAHRVGIIHRDIKASNVFLERLRDGSEVVKVLDFGIAKLIERPADPALAFEDATDRLDETMPDDRALAAALEGPSVVDAFPSLRADPVTAEDATIPDADGVLEPASLGLPLVIPDRGSFTPPPPSAPPSTDALTLQGRVIGTITYMAPEQLAGGEVSAETDVYAIASLVFRLLAGRLPFDGNEVQIAVRKIEGTRPSLRDAGVDVPLDFDRFLQTAFARVPHDRPRSVLEVARAVREAATSKKKRAPADEIGLLTQVSGFARALEELAAALSSPDVGYETVRDRILALDAPLSRLRFVTSLADRALGPRDRVVMEAALSALDEGARKTGAALRGIAERFDYLATLGQRLLKSAHELSRALHGALKKLEAPSDPLRSDPGELFSSDDALETTQDTLEECVSALGAKDPLIAEDGLERLLAAHLEAAVARLAAHGEDPVADDLLRGLWRHADELVLRDLYPPAPGAFRLVPFLAKLGHRAAARPFALLARAFKRSEPVDALSATEQRMLWRCLVLSPVVTVRAEALTRTAPSELWTIIAFPRTPLAVQRQIFERVRELAAPEYLQVFFLCVRDALSAAAARATADVHDDLLQAFALLTAFFSLGSFSEDFVFEPLIELEGELRRAADAVGLDAPAGYTAALDAFRDKGAQAAAPVDSLRDVPLPIQRRLARAGHFLSYFVCHPNERVALETVPHFLKREEIVGVLKLPKIHRAVLLQLVREERFFRKEEARIALLSNPKTPAFVARKYLAFLARAQLKAMSTNKAIGAEVRQLAGQYLKKLPPSTSA